MRPALLILIMDFLVTSLFLYISDTPRKNSYLAHGAIAGVSESLWSTIDEFDKEQNMIADNYYSQYAMANKNIQVIALQDQNREIKEERDKALQEKILTAQDLEATSQELSKANHTIEEARNNILRLEESNQKQAQSISLLASSTERMSRNFEKISEDISQMKSDQKEENKTVASLSEKIDDLPRKIQDDVRNVVNESQRRMDMTAILGNALVENRFIIKQDDVKEISIHLEQLKFINGELLSLLKKLQEEKDPEKSKKLLSGIEEKNAEILRKQNLVESKGFKAMNDISSAPGRINDARIEIDASLADKGWIRNSKADLESYPLVISVGEKLFAVVHGASIGFKWSNVTSDNLQKSDYIIRLLGNSPKSMQLLHAQVISSHCELLVIPIHETIPSLKVYDSLASMQRALPSEIYIFKHKARVAYKKLDNQVEATVNNKSTTLDLNYTLWDFNTPEAGDYLITANGVLLGVMKNSKTCMLITAENFQNLEKEIDFSSTKSFLETVKAYKESCKN